MRNMKTKTIKLSGKDYAQVKDRVKKFREETTNGSIETESETQTDGSMILKATVIVDVSDSGSKRATGQAFGKVSSQKAFEKLETIAVGRALAFLGYLADGEIASSEEMEEFNKFKKEKKDEAIKELEACKTVEDLRGCFMDLGNLMADPDVIKAKDDMKVKLEK